MHVLLSVAVLLSASAGLAPGPVSGLTTKWANEVGPLPHPEYPRPTMVREHWTNLNGTWNLKGTMPSQGPGFFAKREILVPFPIESALGGKPDTVRPGDRWVYQRTFAAKKGSGRTLLHFGAVDWECEVRVNGHKVGEHRGGYDPFTIDLTDSLDASGTNDLQVAILDPSDTGGQPRGKQVLNPGSIFYTPTSGIWQTVWLENQVPETSIDSLHTEAFVDGMVTIRVDLRGEAAGVTQELEVSRAGSRVARSSGEAGQPLAAQIAAPILWSPGHPALYDLRIRLLKDGKVVDSVKSYCAFRSVEVKKDAHGVNRFFLNGHPQFVIGPLDQGFWPDGIYTAPTDAAMRYDLEVTKRLGFNMIRKHVKVEPETWYAACDKLGLMVFQDMPSGDNKTDADKENFKRELQAMIDARRNHPCIVSWVLFNEGWGQHDTEALTKWLVAYEPHRIIDSVTGWTDKGVGAFSDIHAYPGPAMPKVEPNRASFLGEFGGLGLPVPGHMWLEKGWGYQSFKTGKELTDKFVELFENLRFLQGQGLAGAVYTQTTDVETELNGLMTYDRAMLKMDEARVRRAVEALYLPQPTVEDVVPTSEREPQAWHYNTSSDTPSTQWVDPAFDDSAWRRGPGGFGTPETPGAIVRTRWDTKDIYLRRKFTLDRDRKLGDLMLRISHDDDVDVYLDGKLLWKASAWTTSYLMIPMPTALSRGEHTLAIRCHQNEGGQYIDAGIVRIVEKGSR